MDVQYKIAMPEMKLVGIEVRTSFTNEMNSQTAKIAEIVGKYWQGLISEKIPHRKNPGVTIDAYKEYESDYKGNYTYFIGEEVTFIKNIPEGLASLVIPAGQYTKMTSSLGKIPDIIVETWQKVWALSTEQIGGPRKYHIDFEVFDFREKDPAQLTFDLYIGVK